MTLGCCLLAIRWAANQFNSESGAVPRERAAGTWALWLRHLLRDREATPSVAEAMFCGVLILLIRFFLGFALSQTQRRATTCYPLVAVTQLVVVLTPALLMTVMLTRSPRRRCCCDVRRYWRRWPRRCWP